MKRNILGIAVALLGLSVFMTSCTTTFSPNGKNKDELVTVTVAKNLSIYSVDGQKAILMNPYFPGILSLEPGFHTLECSYSDSNKHSTGSTNVSCKFLEDTKYKLDYIDQGTYISYMVRLNDPYLIKSLSSKKMTPIDEEAIKSIQVFASCPDIDYVPVSNLKVEISRDLKTNMDYEAGLKQLKQFAYENGANAILFFRQNTVLRTDYFTGIAVKISE